MLDHNRQIGVTYVKMGPKGAKLNPNRPCWIKMGKLGYFCVLIGPDGLKWVQIVQVGPNGSNWVKLLMYIPCNKIFGKHFSPILAFQPCDHGKLEIAKPLSKTSSREYKLERPLHPVLMNYLVQICIFQRLCTKFRVHFLFSFLLH